MVRIVIANKQLEEETEMEGEGEVAQDEQFALKEDPDSDGYAEALEDHQSIDRPARHAANPVQVEVTVMGEDAIRATLENKQEHHDQLVADWKPSSYEQASSRLKAQQEENDHIARVRMASIITEHKLQFTHIRSDSTDGKGGCTIAWVAPTTRPDESQMIQIAVAWCHPNEQYCNRIGRYLAATQFDEGHRINFRLPLPPGMRAIGQSLTDIFGMCLSGAAFDYGA